MPSFFYISLKNNFMSSRNFFPTCWKIFPDLQQKRKKSQGRFEPQTPKLEVWASTTELLTHLHKRNDFSESYGNFPNT